MERLFPYPKMGESWLEILEDPLTRKLLGHDAEQAEKIPFSRGVRSRLKFLIQDPSKHLPSTKIGYTALEAFLQANCTGPPLDFNSMPVIIPKQYRDPEELVGITREMLESLNVDGIDVYPLAPCIELFWLAKVVLDNETLAENGFNPRRARFRVNFWHQKLLSEPSDTLRSSLYHDANVLDSQLSSRLAFGGAAAQEHMVEFLVERANMRTYYADGQKAREDLLRAAQLRDFDFALTGRLGKKTKYQDKDVSQLVVLAHSRNHEPEPYSSRKSSRADISSRKGSTAERSLRALSLRSPSLPQDQSPSVYAFPTSTALSPTDRPTQPENVLLNDDTLLEETQFARRRASLPDPTIQIVTEQSRLPITLAFMDPNEQKILHPMDSIILLAVASSISNTQAEDGLTREQTLPYAERVLIGGSSNWSVYTRALLVRSRIEGYNARTAERGLLQLQALVDQIIAATTGTVATDKDCETEAEDVTCFKHGPTSFLPKITTDEEERATVAERLRYIHQITLPFRWELESELATRWTQMGGLKTALEIYERLQMHAEVALCLAATDREAEAITRMKALLFLTPDQEMNDGDTVSLHDPPPAEAPRLLCILGDLASQPKYYTLAWTVSSKRYARAQKSLGAFYLRQGDLTKAVEAYTAVLQTARLDVSTWFSLGCIYLEQQQYQDAVETFTRVVQLEDRDYQAWSNLAVALLKLPAPTRTRAPQVLKATEASVDTDDSTVRADVDPLQHTREALRALQRAANLKRDDARIWDNYLTVAASIPPNSNSALSTPWQEVIRAMSEVIRLRSSKEGESCIDLKILDALIEHVTNTYDYPVSTSTEITDPDGNTDPFDEQATDGKDHVSRRASDPDQAEDENDTHITSEELSPTQKRQKPAAAVAAAKSTERLPFLARALLQLIDTQISPLAASAPHLFLLLSKVALWRSRPASSLALIEKYWRATINSAATSAKSSTQPAALVEATRTLVSAYTALGPMERERTGGQVEANWQGKSRSAIRSVLGKAREGEWDDNGHEAEKKELEKMMNELKRERGGE